MAKAKKNKRKNKPSVEQMRLNNIKKKSNSGLSAVKKNPFELKVNKQKHAILNRKVKHNKGLPGVSRSAAVQKRQKTLLVEMNKRYNSSAVLDKRFAATDSTMSLEEKELQRLKTERKRSYNKKNIFNLNDDDELTHMGQPLSQMERLDADHAFSDEDDDDKDQKADASDHFGGFMSKKIDQNLTPIEETIKKSKLAKIERQNQRNNLEELFHNIESAYKEKDIMDQVMRAEDRDREEMKKPKYDDPYKMHKNKMNFDRKIGEATKTKTPQEVAREAAHKKKEMEEERLRRMRGERKKEKNEKGASKPPQQHRHYNIDELNDEFVVETVNNDDEGEILSFPYLDADTNEVDDDDESSDDDDDDGEITPADGYDPDLDGDCQFSTVQADDEDEEEEEEVLSGSGDLGYDEESSRRDSGSGEHEDSDDDDDSDQFSDIDSGNEDSADLASDDEDAVDSDDDNDSVDGIPGRSVATSSKKISTAMTSSSQASTSSSSKIQFPDSFVDFALACDEQTADKLVTKLRHQYAPHLAEGNKDLMASLYGYLWAYCRQTFADKMFVLKDMDPLIGHFYDLVRINPSTCCEITQGYLKRSYHKCFKKPVDKLAMYCPSWPGIDHLIQLKMVKHLFPTSDKYHPVTLPAIIYMTRMLQQCRISSIKDIAAGLFVATMCYEYVSFSKRLLPECLNFLACVLGTRLPLEVVAHQKPVLKAVSSRIFLLRKSGELLHNNSADDETSISQDADDDKIDLMAALSCTSSKKDTDQQTNKLRSQLFSVAIKLLTKFAHLYQSNLCFDELFEPHRQLVERLLLRECGAREKAKVTSLRDVMASYAGKPRKRCTFGRKRPPMLAMIAPKFQDDVGEPFRKRSRKTDPAKREREKLIYKQKQERKGAIREIRKDATFIAAHQQKVQRQEDEERREKVKKIMAQLAENEGEFRNIQRQKYKLNI